jgi:hypothetical protein
MFLFSILPFIFLPLWLFPERWKEMANGVPGGLVCYMQMQMQQSRHKVQALDHPSPLVDDHVCPVSCFALLSARPFLPFMQCVFPVALVLFAVTHLHRAF